MRTPIGSEAAAVEAAALASDPDFAMRVACTANGVVDGFTMVGSGMSRLVLLHDGVVYKATHHGAFYKDAAAKEAEFFGYMERQAVPWAPDFWTYPEHRVTAMPLYRPTTPEAYARSGIRGWAEQYLADARWDNFGERPDGSLVLLDGDQVRHMTTYADTTTFLSGRLNMGGSKGGLGRSLLGFNANGGRS